MAWNLPPDPNAMGGVFGAQDLPLWMQSGMMQPPPAAPYQAGDLRRGMPLARATGVGESVANALLPRRDEQGMPQAPGAGDFINAALWAVPGARGSRPQAPKASGFDMLQQVAHDTTQQGVKGVLGLDKPPPSQTHGQYIEQRTGKMSRPQFLESDALWGMARDLAAQKNISLSQAFNELANPVLSKRFGAALTPEEMSNMGLGAAQHGIGPSRHGGWD